MPESGTQGKEGKMEKEKIFQIKLNLMESEWKIFWKQAAVYGATPGEMLERFIHDTVWQHTKAMEWCDETFWMENQDTFLGYLCQHDCVDILEDIKDARDTIAGMKEQMEKGVMYTLGAGGLMRRTWQELGYVSREEFSKSFQEDIKEEESFLTSVQGELQELWEEFQESNPYHTETYEEEMEKVDAWVEKYMKSISETEEKEEKEFREHSADRDAEPAPREKGPKL